MKPKTRFKQAEIGMIPEGWEVKTLKEISDDVSYGYTASAKEDKIGPKFLRITDIVPYFIDWNSVPYCKIDKKNYERCKLKIGDLVIARTGATTGYNAVIKKEVDAVFASYLIRFRLKNTLAYPFFIEYVMKSNLWKNFLREIIGGSAQPGANAKQFGNFELPFPPFQEQQSIAKILSDLDSKIELNQQTNKTLEAIGQAIFKHWFIDFEFPNEEGKPYKSSDGKMVDSELGEMPEGWAMSSLGQLHGKAEDCVITGPFGSNLHASDYRETGTPLILVKHVKAGRIAGVDMPLVGTHKFPEMNRYLLKIGDIVFTRVAVVGESAYIRKRNENWMISGQMLRVRANANRISSRYLAQVFQQKIFKDQVSNYAVGSTRPSLNTKLLLSFKFVLPPLSLQKKFSGLLESADAQIENKLNEIDNLSSIRDSLLPKLMSGKIRVPVEVK